MNTKRVFTRAAVASMLTIFLLSLAIAAPGPGQSGPYIDQLWYELIKTPDAQLTALLTHTVDQGGVPRPEDLPTLIDAGFTITTTVRIGYTMWFENNLVFPTSDMDFRKALHRLIDKDYIVGNIYAPLMGKCEYYLPPPSQFVNPDAMAPGFNPGSDPTETGTGTGTAYLNEAGFTMHPTAVNPYYDPAFPWSAPRMRIDPRTGSVLSTILHTSRTTTESPLAYEMAVFMNSYFRKAGLPFDLLPKTWSEFINILTNEDYTDYTTLTGVGIVWGSTSPDILYDFLQSGQLPLWNCWNYADAEMDEWASLLKGTLDIEEFKNAAYKMQELAVRDEPYLPLLLWNQFAASTGPYEPNQPGMDALVNHKGIGAINNFWSLLYSRREAPMKDLLKRYMGAEMTTHNPLMANTVPDWQIMTPVIGGTFVNNPYTGNPWFFGHTTPPVQEPWVGPDGEEGTDDDGMITTFNIRDDIVWDDGTPMTSADWEFTMELLKRQNNVRYRSYWQFYDHTEIISPTQWKEYATERFVYRYESMDVGFLCPKHIWEPFIAGPDGVLWTADDVHHSTWRGWEETGPSPGGTKLLGIGAFVYPMGCWQPTSSHIDANRNWWAGKVCLGDVDLNTLVELPDLSFVLDAQGAKPGMPVWERPDDARKVEMLGPVADIAAPAQIVAGAEISVVIGHFGHSWGPGVTPE